MERNRRLNPDNREASSSYKINIEKRLPDEDLVVNIYDENGSPFRTYHFDAKQLCGRKSIHFKYANGSIDWIPKDLEYDCE